MRKKREKLENLVTKNKLRTAHFKRAARFIKLSIVNVTAFVNHRDQRWFFIGANA